MGAKDYNGCVATMQRALALEPENRRFIEEEDEARRRLAQLERQRQLQREGEQALARGDPQRAVQLFDEALQLAPDDTALRAENEEAHAELARQQGSAKLRAQGEAQLVAYDCVAAAATLAQATRLVSMNHPSH